MFTGIVEALGRVAALGSSGTGLRLTVAVPREAGWRLGPGESVAVSGVCLTVVTEGPGTLGFDLAEETRRLTTLGDLGAGDPVNLERPLRLDSRLGGHLVLGHVDGIGRVTTVRPEGEGRRLGVALPAALRRLVIPKGSVTVDGVSLTVAGLEAEAFEVALIPHTLAVTTLGSMVPGARANLEMDVIGKYVQALMSPDGTARPAVPGDSWTEGARR